MFRSLLLRRKREDNRHKKIIKLQRALVFKLQIGGLITIRSYISFTMYCYYLLKNDNNYSCIRIGIPECLYKKEAPAVYYQGSSFSDDMHI